MSVPCATIERSDQHPHVAVLRLNRPEKLNAIDRAMSADIHAALDELDGLFPELRVVVLTGSGRGFCSGADLALAAANLAGGKVKPVEGRHVSDIAPRLRRLPQPVIGAINGVAAGAGLSIALACDLRIAADEARFSCMFIKRSLIPDTAASYTLQRLLGPGLAAEMALTGRIYDAAFALRTGMVNATYPADRLMPEALAMAAEIAANPPLAVRATKTLLDQYAMDLEQAVIRETEANHAVENTQDRRESVLAFLEKRAPVFRGH